MRITIVGRQARVTEDIKSTFEKKLKKFERFFNEDAAVNVTLSYKRNKEYVELTISSKGMLFRAEKCAETYFNALDECIEAIDRQVRKNKTKLEKKLREGAFLRTSGDEPYEEIEEEKEYEFKVKRFFVKPMTPEEAVLEMNLTEHSFFVFRNSEDNQINVVYAKDDGNYGLIIPE